MAQRQAKGKPGLRLRRKVGESIWIEDVEVEVVEIDRGKVKLRINAHPDVKVDRAEVREAKERTKQKAKEAELCGTSS